MSDRQCPSKYILAVNLVFHHIQIYVLFFFPSAKRLISSHSCPLDPIPSGILQATSSQYLFATLPDIYLAHLSSLAVSFITLKQA